MRTSRRMRGVAGFAAGLTIAAPAIGGAVLGGCLNGAEDCSMTLSCASSASSGAGGDGGTPVGCVPNQNDAAVGDACGVFVATNGNDGGAGTKSEPVKTLGAAILRAQEHGTRRVYACAETFEEAVEVPGGVTVFGGLDCANGWGWVGETTRTTVTAAEGVIPLRMLGGQGEGAVHIEDVEVVARSIDAMARPELLGASSIAAVAEGGSVELVRCALVAGDAADGEEGAAGAPRDMNGEVTPAIAGADGNNGGTACSAAVVTTPSKLNDCGTPGADTDNSRGGSGGIGEEDDGGDGNNGSPVAAMNGGLGEEGMVTCMPGTAGDAGAPGQPGAGATGLGTISSSGYAGVPGGEGGKGAPGQGGGGGGGVKGGTGVGKCPDPLMAGGASGGSGASGGCGGLPGKGGGAGGSSIALISLNASFTFNTVILRTGPGGVGGNGGAPQPGGNGGAMGGAGGSKGTANNLTDACSGGPGGKGGDGGLGGGGLGGHSIGIAYQGTAPSMEGTSIETSEAGAGGPGADPQYDGAAGVQAVMQAFP